jgi:hypothetical protein
VEALGEIPPEHTLLAVSMSACCRPQLHQHQQRGRRRRASTSSSATPSRPATFQPRMLATSPEITPTSAWRRAHAPHAPQTCGRRHGADGFRRVARHFVREASTPSDQPVRRRVVPHARPGTVMNDDEVRR